MDMARLGAVIGFTALLFAYYFATAWLARRVWRSGRISTRSYAFVIVGRLHFALLFACLLSPVLFGAPAGAALIGVAAIGFLLAIRLVVVTRSMPAFEETLANPQSVDFAGWTRGEKWIVGAFVLLFGLASFALVVLMIALSTRG